MSVIYLLVCAAPPANQTSDVISAFQKEDWDVCVIASPQGTRWIDIPLLESLTGHIVRTDYKLPGEADPLPKADVILLMPATFNTINKIATGISDTLVTGIVCECLGRGNPPIIIVPCLKMDLVRHPAFQKNIALLKEYGVTLLHEPERYKSPAMVPLEDVIEALKTVIK